MAKQTGPIYAEATIGNVTFYKMDGKYYVRQKSSLSGRRVKTSPRFENTMRNARILAQGSSLGSKIYWEVRTGKNRSLYQRITGDAILLFKQGMEWEEAEAELLKKYQRKAIKKQAYKKPKAEVVQQDNFVEKVLQKALIGRDEVVECAPYAEGRKGFLMGNVQCSIDGSG